MDNRDFIIRLYDLYKDLLTLKQQTYFEAYYFDDLSLGEIAQMNEVSRNAIFDQVKKVVNSLYNFEEKLHLNLLSTSLEKLLDVDNLEEIKKEIRRILNT